VISRADLEAYKTKIEILISRASRLVKAGVPRDQLARLKTDDIVWHFNSTGDQLKRFYADLVQATQPENRAAVQ
jgi:hypothetical protein